MLEEPPMYSRNSFVYREGKVDRKRIWMTIFDETFK